VGGGIRSTVVTAAILAVAPPGCGRVGFDAERAVTGDGSPGDVTSGDTLPDAALPRMTLVKKTDAPDWTPLTGPVLGLPYGILTWEPSGPAFRFHVEAMGLAPGQDYTLVQYIDPWPGAPATDIGAATVDSTGLLVIPWSSYELDRDLTTTTGKLWLVPSAMIDPVADVLLTWDVTAILFELDFVVYDDTDVP